MKSTKYADHTRIALNLLNSQSVYPPIPINGIKLSVRLDGRTVKSVTDVSGGTLVSRFRPFSLMLFSF